MGSEKVVDVNFSQADDFIPGIGMQGIEGLSQTSYVPDFDPSQTKKGDEWWTPRTSVRDSIAPLPSHWEKWNKGKGLQLTDSPLRTYGSPQSSLYYCSEESWLGFTEWVKKPTPLPLGPSILNLSIATRIVSPGKWLGNEEMDAVMFIWRVNTTFQRWAPSRVAFMKAMFCLQIHAAYNKFLANKKAYELPDFLLGYGRGEIPSHGRTDQVWGVDVDRLYFPLFVNGNHLVAVCVNINEKKVEVFDCGGGKNRQYIEKFSAMIPRIVKAVAPPKRQKQLLLASYSIVDDKEAVKKWKNADRIRLIYLAIILCVVLARDEKANIPLKYIKVVMDLEKVRNYPWGVAACDLLYNSITKTRDNLKDKTTSYVLDGFSYAFQIWAMEAVPKIGKLCGKKLDKGSTNGPRCINWVGAGKVSYEEIIRLEQILTPEDDIYAYIGWRGNYNVKS
uniref:Ubiquitin-like protease family profile domain-containing protein n=1 Tax=Brassica oleracea var. oleracea TaxID=109376 RepID=A0A0D3DKA7_BRAOL